MTPRSPWRSARERTATGISFVSGHVPGTVPRTRPKRPLVPPTGGAGNIVAGVADPHVSVRALIATRRAAIDATEAARSAPAAASPLTLGFPSAATATARLGHLRRNLAELERDRDDPLHVLVRPGSHERSVGGGVGVCQRLGTSPQLLGAADDLGPTLPVVGRKPRRHAGQPRCERDSDGGNGAAAGRRCSRGNRVEELLDARVEKARRAQPCARLRRCRR